MRKSRLVPVALAAAVLVASTSPVHAQTAPEVDGVGTTTGALSVLELAAGDLVSLELLTDSASANIDDAAGARSAAAQIAALALDTAVTEPVSVPLLAVESTGEQQDASQEVAVPANPLVTGAALPLALGALVDDAGARSTLTAALTDLDVLGGILGLAGADVDLASSAAPTEASGTRTVDVGTIGVLDLEALLATLGIPLTDLPLDTVLDLLSGLGLDTDDIVAALDGVLTDVDGVLADITDVEELTAAIAELEAAKATLQADATACDSLGGLDDLLGGDDTLAELCSDVTTTITAVDAEIATLQASLDALPSLSELADLLAPLVDQLEALLDTALGLLSGVPLLSLDGVDVGVQTLATDDPATSVADVTGTLGAIQVGALPALGGLDLLDTADQLNGLLDQAETTIGSVLGTIAPDLADLVAIRTLEETTSVVEEDGRVTSSAAFTGLQVDVLPINVDLDALLATLGGTDSVGAVAEDLGVALPELGATEVLALNELLAPVTDGLPLLGALSALEDGLNLQVASLSQSSTFTPFAASAPVAPGAPAAPAAPTLPRTGSQDGLLLALAGAAVLAALGGRHLVRRADGEA